MSKHYTNYNQYSNANKQKDVAGNTEPLTTPISQDVPDEPSVPVTVSNPEPTPVAIIGAVSNCKKLNVRTNPDKTSDVICVINAGDEVEIMSEGETSDFYCVHFNDVIGFCMKEYIAIKE